MKNNFKKKHTNIKAFTILILSILMLNTAHANIGSINIDNISDNSISINWSWPNNYQDTGGNHNKICYEIQGTLSPICNNSNLSYSGNNNKTISGLTANTTYKIRVKCHCKKWSWGQFRFPMWRTVATITVTTDASPIIPTTSSLTVHNITSDSLTAKLTHDDMLAFDNVRVCYRKKWSIYSSSFESDCRYGGFWFAGNYVLAELNISPYFVDANNSVNVELDSSSNDHVNLKSCTKYKIMGVGIECINTHLDDIGNTIEIETSPPCKLFKISQVIVSDYEDILLAYARKVDEFYEQSLFDTLARQDESLYLKHDIFLTHEQEDITITETLLRYLVEVDSSMYDEWQDNRSIKENRLTLENYLEDNHPVLYEDLIKELQN